MIRKPIGKYVHLTCLSIVISYFDAFFVVHALCFSDLKELKLFGRYANLS